VQQQQQPIGKGAVMFSKQHGGLNGNVVHGPTSYLIFSFGLPADKRMRWRFNFIFAETGFASKLLTKPTKTGTTIILRLRKNRVIFFVLE